MIIFKKIDWNKRGISGEKVFFKSLNSVPIIWVFPTFKLKTFDCMWRMSVWLWFGEINWKICSRVHRNSFFRQSRFVFNILCEVALTCCGGEYTVWPIWFGLFWFPCTLPSVLCNKINFGTEPTRSPILREQI